MFIRFLFLGMFMVVLLLIEELIIVSSEVGNCI